MKRNVFILAAACLACFAMGAVSGVAFSGQDHGTFMGYPVILLRVDGQPVQVALGDTPPLFIGGRVMVPLRMVGNAVGAKVSWDGAALAANLETPLLAVAVLEEAIVTDGITATVESVTYGADNSPTVALSITNGTDKTIPSGLCGRLRYTLTDPDCEPAINREGPLVEASIPGDVGPGQSFTVSYRYGHLPEGVLITSVSLSMFLRDENGFYSLSPVGAWDVPSPE
jgi:hypothetical protein